MNLYGDRGNVIALKRRAEWHGLNVRVTVVSTGDKVDFAGYDILFLGSGPYKAQQLVGLDFQKVKGASLAEAVECDIPFLAIAGGFQLLGSYYRMSRNEVLKGLGVLDIYTKPGRKRLTGNAVIVSDLFSPPKTLAGFENHWGRTYLGPRVKPLGTTLLGYGNNSMDKTEGAIHKNTIGTYLHGPLLPKNPWLVDWLISRALERRYGETLSFEPCLCDHLEKKAHESHVLLAARKAGKTAAALPLAHRPKTGRRPR